MASFATFNSHDHPVPKAFSKVKYFNLREIVPGSFAIVSGLLVSVWTLCVLFVLYLQDSRYAFERSNMVIEKMIMMHCQTTYAIIVISGIASLCYGLKNNDKSFVYPWLVTKILESTVLLIGAVWIVVYGSYTGLALPAFLFHLLGYYLYRCAWQTIKNMSGHPPPTEEATKPLQTVIDEKPPSYDNLTN